MKHLWIDVVQLGNTQTEKAVFDKLLLGCLEAYNANLKSIGITVVDYGVKTK